VAALAEVEMFTVTRYACRIDKDAVLVERFYAATEVESYEYVRKNGE